MPAHAGLGEVGGGGCPRQHQQSLPLPTVWAPLAPAGGDVWQPASLVQVSSGETDRNAPLGEHLAFLLSVPAHSTSPVPVQDRRTVTPGHCQESPSKGC